MSEEKICGPLTPSSHVAMYIEPEMRPQKAEEQVPVTVGLQITTYDYFYDLWKSRQKV